MEFRVDERQGKHPAHRCNGSLHHRNENLVLEQMRDERRHRTRPRTFEGITHDLASRCVVRV